MIEARRKAGFTVSRRGLIELVPDRAGIGVKIKPGVTNLANTRH